MRLGDLDDLKIHISELLLVYSGAELANAILNAIDNAPTVDCSDELSEMTFSHALTVEERQDLTRAYLIGRRAEQRPQGNWIGDDDYESCQGFYEAYKCSNCGYGLHWRDTSEYNFCPNCGANMRGGNV